MVLQKAFKFRIALTGSQCSTARKTAGCRRYVYNRALALQMARRAAGGGYIRYQDMAQRMVAWKKEVSSPWLSDAPAQALQQALMDLDRAFQNFFAGRTQYPTFKKKGRGDAFRYPQPGQISLDPANNRLLLPKLGWIRYRNSRDVTGELRNVTISATGDKWFASIQTQQEVPDPVPTVTSAVGADVGIVRFVTLSDGTHVAPCSPFRQHMAALAKAQRQLSHKVKFSQNWKKARSRVTRLHTTIANIRRDFLHQTTSTLSKNHALVAIEDLQVTNMSASAAGTVAAPGKRVRQKAGLNRSIMDQGWGEFRRQLDYKLRWQGGWLVPVPPQNTSRTCPCCGHVAAGNRKSQSAFLCEQCWYENHADTVGAINILDRALASLAREASGCITNQGQDMPGSPVK